MTEAEKERAAVVEFLRRLADGIAPMDDLVCVTAKKCADFIESGKHLKEGR